jgi:hypothetical protein
MNFVDNACKKCTSINIGKTTEIFMEVSFLAAELSSDSELVSNIILALPPPSR